MDEEELQAARETAIADGRCFSKSRLKDEFKMKPKKGVEAVTFYKNDYGVKFGVYKLADCEPITTINTKPPSEKQIQARKVLAIKAKLRSKAAKVSGRAVRWLENNPVALDTETTGLDAGAQIVEISICDMNGVALFETKLRPTVKIDPSAEKIHGISECAVATAPSWPDVSKALQDILSQRPVIIFNADFDARILHQTAVAFGDDPTWIVEMKTYCAMRLAAEFYGATNRHGSISLAKATEFAGVSWRGNAHSARADTLATIDLVHAIAETKTQLDKELIQLLGNTPKLASQ